MLYCGRRSQHEHRDVAGPATSVGKGLVCVCYDEVMMCVVSIMHACISIYIYIYIYIYVCTHVCIYIYIYIYTHTYIYIYIYIHIYV